MPTAPSLRGEYPVHMQLIREWPPYQRNRLCLRMFCATTALMKTVPLLWCAYTAHGWRHWGASLAHWPISMRIQHVCRRMHCALEDSCALVQRTHCARGISYINICNLYRCFIHVEGIMGDRLLVLNNVILMQAMQAEMEAAAGVLVMMRRRRRRQRRVPNFWVRPWLQTERKLLYGHYDRLMEELRQEDQQSFSNFIRMPPEMFDELLNRVGPRIQLQDTNIRRALEPGLKLAVTLRHLSSGDKYSTLQYDFRVARTTIVKFLPVVCQAIVDELKDEVVICPTTPEQWRETANEFWRRWNVPHACAALDGKHCAIRCPPNSGSLYYNYKGFFSIVLLAMVDADYKFLWTDVGGYGSMSDAQIYNESDLKEALEDNTIGLPPADPLPHDDRNVPYFLLGDDAFGLRTYLMKPFALRGLTREEMIANYRFSRGRRVVENAFGILVQRWQILLGTMLQVPETAQVIVEACICLHNMMRLRYPGLQNAILDQEDEDHNIIPGAWRDGVELLELQRARGPNRDAVIAKRQREYLKMYFNSAAGSVSWQDRMIAL